MTYNLLKHLNGIWFFNRELLRARIEISRGHDHLIVILPQFNKSGIGEFNHWIIWLDEDHSISFCLGIEIVHHVLEKRNRFRFLFGILQGSDGTNMGLHPLVTKNLAVLRWRSKYSLASSSLIKWPSSSRILVLATLLFSGLFFLSLTILLLWH